jgi:hypothetical protein
MCITVHRAIIFQAIANMAATVIMAAVMAIAVTIDSTI